LFSENWQTTVTNITSSSAMAERPHEAWQDGARVAASRFKSGTCKSYTNIILT